MPRSGRLRATVVPLLAAATVAVGGLADAYWSGPGDGADSGGTGSTTEVTLAPGTTGNGLSPGGTADVALSIHNPNDAQVRIGSLELDATRAAGGFAVDPAHAGCTPLSVLTLAAQDNGGAGWTVPGRVGASDGVLPVTLSGALGMSTAAANACQGASFTVYLTATP